MRALSVFTVLGAMLVVGLGCESNPTKPTTPAVSVSPASATASAAAAPPFPSGDRRSASAAQLGDDYADEAVPVAGDFEAEAAKAITKDNYKEKLAELEEEIGGVVPPGGSASASASAASSVPPPAAPAPAPAAPK